MRAVVQIITQISIALVTRPSMAFEQTLSYNKKHSNIQSNIHWGNDGILAFRALAAAPQALFDGAERKSQHHMGRHPHTEPV